MITEATLRRLYEEEELSMREVSARLGVSVGAVFNYMKKYGIPSRPKMTEKVKAKISMSQKGKESPLKGKKATEETRRKLSLSKKGRFTKPTEFGGHKKKRQDGYIYVYVPSHPYSTSGGYVMEHILVMEQAIGRYITREEVVHHKNHKRDDNRLENLELMTFKKHAALHTMERWKNGGIPQKTVKVRNIETGEVFDSVRSAAKKYNVAPSKITRVCRHERKKTRNFHWEYVKEI